MNFKREMLDFRKVDLTKLHENGLSTMSGRYAMTVVDLRQRRKLNLSIPSITKRKMAFTSI